LEEKKHGMIPGGGSGHKLMSYVKGPGAKRYRVAKKDRRRAKEAADQERQLINKEQKV